MKDRAVELGPYLVGGLSFLTSLLASFHAVLNKRDSRAAALWLGFILLFPFAGPLLYLALGIHPMRRHALALGMGGAPGDTSPTPVPDDMGDPHELEADHLRMRARVVDRVPTRPWAAATRVQPLVNGDQVFPAMLAAINEAASSIS